MATSAFRSTSKRSSIGASPGSAAEDSSNRSSAHRRSRSLSRFSRRLPEPESPFPDHDEAPAPRGRFVNTMRGSGFPEISLDDLAIEFFSSGDRGRSASKNSEVSPRNGGTGSQRRGRSVSRQSSGTAGGTADRRKSICNASGGGRMASENHSRRRRSVSVARCPVSDSESDLDLSYNASAHGKMKSFSNGNNPKPLSGKPTPTNQRQLLRRSSSQKDLKSYDDYSSQSSALTDEEVRDTYSSKNGIERIIRAVYSQSKAEHPMGDDVNVALYEAMRKEVRHAMEDMRMDIEQRILRGTSLPRSGDELPTKNDDVLDALSSLKRNYATKLEQSEKHKQDLLAEIVLEEQRSREVSQVVNQLLPDWKTAEPEKPLRVRRRSSDKNRMSKRLTEEAEKYIEDFILNVEDTDISSIDGERSDTSSSLGGIVKPEPYQTPVSSKPLPVEMDGVVLPWLQWETSNDASPQSYKNKIESSPLTPPSTMWVATQESNNEQDQSSNSISSHGSWTPATGTFTGISRDLGESKGFAVQHLPPTSIRVDPDDYVNATSDEDFLFENWSQQKRITSGGLHLCNHMFF